MRVKSEITIHILNSMNLFAITHRINNRMVLYNKSYPLERLHQFEAMLNMWGYVQKSDSLDWLRFYVMTMDESAIEAITGTMQS